VSKSQRQERYKTTGGAADLVKVETLVPAACRAQILELAAKLRDEHRHRKAVVDIIVAKVRAACAGQPRRFSQPIDIDRVVVTSVNVPFPKGIDAATLAASLHANTIPSGYTGHFERFLGEVPLTDVLRFCDRHGVTANVLARYVKTHGKALALRRPELERHLNALVPDPRRAS